MPPKSRKRKTDSSDDEAAVARAPSSKPSLAEQKLRAREWMEKRKAQRSAAAAKSPAAATPAKPSKPPARKTTRKSVGTTTMAGVGAVRKKAATATTARASSPPRTPARKKARVATSDDDDDNDQDDDSALGTSLKAPPVTEADEAAAASARKQAAKLDGKRRAAAWAEARRAAREAGAAPSTTAKAKKKAPAPFNSPTPPARSSARRQRPPAAAAPAPAAGGAASLFDGETVEMEDATADAAAPPPAPAPSPIPAATPAAPEVPTPPPAAAFGRLPPAPSRPTEAQIERQAAEDAKELEARIERQAAENAAEAMAQLERRAAERQAAAVAAAARPPLPSVGREQEVDYGVGGGLRQRRGAQPTQQESVAARFRAEAAAAALVRSAALAADTAAQQPYLDGTVPSRQEVDDFQSASEIPLSPQEKMERDFNDAQQHRILKTHTEEADIYEDFDEKNWVADKRDRVGRVVADLGSFVRKCVRYAGLAAVFGLVAAALYFAIGVTSSLWAPSPSPPGRGKGEAGDGGLPAGADLPIDEAPSSTLRCFLDSPGVPTPESIMSPEEVYGKWFAGPLADGQGSCFTPEDEEPLPCPDHGRCAGRYLRDCLGEGATVGEGHPIFVVNETFDGCVLSSAAKQVVEDVTQALVDLMVERVCSFTCMLSPGGKGCSIANKDVIVATSDDGVGSSEDKSGSSVAFDLHALVKFMNSRDNDASGDEGDDTADDADIVAKILPFFDQDVVRHGEKPRPETDKKKKKGEAGDRPPASLHVGLADDFVVERLPLPTLCYLRILFLDLISLILKLLLSAFRVLAQIGWGVFYNYPLPTSVALVGLYVINWIRETRRRRAELRSIVSDIRELAYDKLVQCDDGEGYAMLFLRDDLGHEMHPNSAAERKRMFNEIWPKVVREVRLDNRVRKVERTVGGKSLEHWEWIATGTAKKSRRRGRMVEGFE